MANDRKTLSLRVTLDGTAAVKTDLTAIGATGEKAAKQLRAGSV